MDLFASKKALSPLFQVAKVEEMMQARQIIALKTLVQIRPHLQLANLPLRLRRVPSGPPHTMGMVWFIS